MRKLLTSLAALALIGGSVVSAEAAPCRDAKGHFIKCPAMKPMMVRCKDKAGRFAKCGTPGAHPV